MLCRLGPCLCYEEKACLLFLHRRPAPQTDDLAPDFNRRPENIYGWMEFHPLSWPLECGLEQTFSVICTFTASPLTHFPVPPFPSSGTGAELTYPPPLSLFHQSFLCTLSLSIVSQYRVPSVIHIHIFEQAKKQWFVSVTFSNGSGSLDPYTGLRILIPDPSLFGNGLQDANKK